MWSRYVRVELVSVTLLGDVAQALPCDCDPRSRSRAMALRSVLGGRMNNIAGAMLIGLSLATGQPPGFQLHPAHVEWMGTTVDVTVRSFCWPTRDRSCWSHHVQPNPPARNAHARLLPPHLHYATHTLMSCFSRRPHQLSSPPSTG